MRFLATVGFITLLPLIILLGMKLFQAKTMPDLPTQTVLTLDLGENFPESPALKGLQQILTGPTTTFFELLRALSAAELDPKVKGIVLRLNDPALGLAQLEELREALMTFRKNGKFVMVYADTFGDLSPGTKKYYLASCADQIWMQPFSSLNLTGTQVDQPFFGSVLKKLGVLPQISTRKEYKNAYASLTDSKASDANKEATTNLLQRLHDKLMADITEGRELSATALQEVTRDNPMMSDQEAKTNHFIDRLGYIDEFKQAALDKASAEGTAQSNADKKDLKKAPAFVSIHYYSALVNEALAPQEEKIALIYGVGAVLQDDKEGGGLMGQSYIMGADETRRSFEEALKNPQIKAVVFRIDSPGGSAVASETVRRLIHIAQDQGVPVVASLGNVAASGGYWFAAPCKKILAKNMTITGSIGTIGGKVVFRELLENFDVNISTMAVGENGSLWSPLTAYTDDQQRHIDRTMDLLYARFIEIVAQGRGLSLDHVGEIAKGRVWTGEEAKTFGLVDEIGGLREAFAAAKELGGIAAKNPYEIVVYPRPKTVLENLQQALLGKSSFSVVWKNITQLFAHFKLLLSGDIKLMASENGA
ncbi:MAG: signal peptide peptidase SppA [Alphaproteobacteria bacterium]|nr:signal peptide peptidase SppA [Alphaproteobacteria bacterium]NCQ66312.1 signal peptide peptidase SppA [Alphaproteobacteria bacterium]NCT06798.1 signal peptide peptidase SppA [Alphaproteobacteria bacterium]